MKNSKLEKVNQTFFKTSEGVSVNSNVNEGLGYSLLYSS